MWVAQQQFPNKTTWYSKWVERRWVCVRDTMHWKSRTNCLQVWHELLHASMLEGLLGIFVNNLWGAHIFLCHRYLITHCFINWFLLYLKAKMSPKDWPNIWFCYPHSCYLLCLNMSWDDITSSRAKAAVTYWEHCHIFEVIVPAKADLSPHVLLKEHHLHFGLNHSFYSKILFVTIIIDPVFCFFLWCSNRLLHIS